MAISVTDWLNQHPTQPQQQIEGGEGFGGGLLQSLLSTFDDRQKYLDLYTGIANGTISVSPSEFNKILTQNSDAKTIDVNEWGVLSPQTQQWAINNPQAFMQSVLAHRNPANQDLMSIGAEGGYLTSSMKNVIPTSNGLDWSGANYLDIHDDNGLLGPILTVASIIPSPIQPFAMAANAAYQASQGNYLSAALSAVGANAGFEGVDSFVLADAKNLADQGLSLSQISDTIGQTYGANAAASLTAAVGGYGQSAVGGSPTLVNAGSGALKSAMTGRDPVQGALGGGISGMLSGIDFAKQVGITDPEIAKAFNQYTMSGAKQLATGGNIDIESFLKNSALNYGANTAWNSLGVSDTGTKNLLTGLLGTAYNGGNLNNMAVNSLSNYSGLPISQLYNQYNASKNQQSGLGSKSSTIQSMYQKYLSQKRA